MLRGSSRHDGIPNKQSAKDPDRDRQREQQRKERAQMLPDDKEIHAGTHDLFNAPVKVKPSIEDTTSLQIRNSLGNFEPIRRLMEYPGTSQPPQAQIQQTFLTGPAAAAAAADRGYHSVTSASSALAPHRNTNHNIHDPPAPLPPSYRPPPSSSSLNSFPPTIPPESNSTKSHYQQRNLYHVNHHPSSGVVSNNINSNSSNTSSAFSSSSSSNTGSTSGSLLSTNSNFRASNNHHQLIPPISKVPQQNQPPSLLSTLNATTVFNSNSSNNPPALTTTVPSISLNNSGPILNRSPNFNSNNNQQVKPKYTTHPASFGVNFNDTQQTISGVEVKVDGASVQTTTESSVFNNNERFSNRSNNSIRDPKCNKTVVPHNKPAPERADSQLTLESILKEMTDVIPPLTAILTPVKDNSKRLPPRRSSKSEEKIVQSIIDSGMAKIPSPVPRMESSAESSSSESDSDSDSEDSASSGSRMDDDKADTLGSSSNPNTGSPTTKWNLSSFLKNENIVAKPVTKSPKDNIKSNSFSSLDSSDPMVDEFGMLITDRTDSVTSTVSNKNQPPPSPVEIAPTSVALETRAKLAARTTRGSSNSRPEPHIPVKPTPPTIPVKVASAQSKDKVSSLSASSSEDEAEPIVKPNKRKSGAKATSQSEDKKASTSGATTAKRPRPSVPPPAATPITTTTTTARHAAVTKSGGESSPENKLAKGSKNGQDKNKTDTIRKLFRFGNKPNAKVQSPSFVETGDSGGGKIVPATAPSATTGKSGSNRVSGKGGKTSSSTSAPHNGDIVSFSDNKKKEGSKEKSSQSKKHPKQSTAKSSAASAAKSNSPNQDLSGRLKDDGKSGSSSNSSSLIVRIPLQFVTLMRRKKQLEQQQQQQQQQQQPAAVNPFPAQPSIVSPSLQKMEKELEKISKVAKSVAASTVTSEPPHRVPKVPQNSSRVGSSSDPTIVQPSLKYESGISHTRDDPLCSRAERLSPVRSKKRPKKKSRASPKKAKPKREPPDSRTKLEGYTTDAEVSSANVVGYPPCDSITRTPPIDPDVVQAPDSSLNPSHLPTIPPQVQYFSYFEKNDIKDDLFSRDQDSYLEEAKKLKHSADQERTSTAQASIIENMEMYLEAGLYFILTGIIMERDAAGNSNASYTMYRDTLTLIQYIGTRWRSARLSGPGELQNQEAKIITLSMRCQALLFCKLFKMKMKETRDMVSNMHDYFTKAVVREPMIVTNSPQLSTPSPHSPTSSPAGSSGVLQHTPSPHHQQNHMLPIPRNLYNHIQKQCGNTYNCIMAHDTWEQADAYVSRYRLEDFFIGVDRQVGPLTLHSTLVDLVRYVRHGLQVINGS
ncbi:AF4/FMR2 family member lilli isoform X1 [Folsomia candida]|uniref:AF4/FMR2 family member lilli isoform X1 n=1 Tax=Folsomia candida TaxID=158441 RepID=UPI00160519D1|nr:AF4/FMR2 family member lilli isoform X1 [Folsomia candida]XP_035708997.1 AF4/FMR2 family member lilli isoform X1 [Folsomia candida]